MKRLGFALLLIVAGILAGCSPRLVKGPAEISESVPPDSLKAKFALELNDSEGSHTLSGILFAVPHKRYRLELSGPMGVGIASLLWADGEWTMLLTAQKEFLSGKGYLVGGAAGLPFFDIHQIAGIFWGEALPQNGTIDSTKDGRIFGKNAAGIPFVAVKNADGRIAEIFQGAERIEFKAYAEFGERIAPSEASVYRLGENVLNIRVKSVRTDASWGNGTWRLPVPKNYRRLEF